MGVVKSSVIGVLRPLAAISHKIGEPLARVWRMTKAQNRIGIDASNVLLGSLNIEGTGNIAIKGGGYFYHNLYLETQGSGMIDIGEGAVISSGTHIVSFAKVEIGDKAMIGEYCSIRDANHRIGTAADYRDSGHDQAAIKIGRNVWLGRGVCVLAGVTIGDNAVIGANSVVTKAIPANCLAVGAPAKVIRENISPKHS
jgi:acetyltransferase-like isoleucine patch superfamily enzyme